MIIRFRDEHYFLSNFYSVPIIHNNIVYNNAESVFQSEKLSLDTHQRLTKMMEFSILSGKEARVQGRKIVLRDDWEDVRVEIMLTVLREKFFQNEELANKLIATGSEEICEHNYWHDNY